MARPGRWWSRTRGLPTAVHDSWRDALRVVPGAEPRILAWALTTGDASDEASDEERDRPAGAYAIGSPAVLSVGDEDGWWHVAWDQIERGGWDAETRLLMWTAYGGQRGSVALAEPARMPELFRERVAASIVVEQFVRLRGERGVTVHGRRSLGASGAPIVWHATLGRGLDWSTPGLREAADAAIEELRREYDPAPVRW